MAFVYILRCADGSYYVGSTTDLKKGWRSTLKAEDVASQEPTSHTSLCIQPNIQPTKKPMPESVKSTAGQEPRKKN